MFSVSNLLDGEYIDFTYFLPVLDSRIYYFDLSDDLGNKTYSFFKITFKNPHSFHFNSEVIKVVMLRYIGIYGEISGIIIHIFYIFSRHAVSVI